MKEPPKSILAIDVGSGTQDIFFWKAGATVENCVQMVLPSPTVLLARRVQTQTFRGRPLHLEGHLMGGGPLAWAVRDHASAGLSTTASKDAALTLHDNLEHVREMGIEIRETPRDGTTSISLGDIQKNALEETLSRFGVDLPEMWCVAVQDHGHQPEGSNREFRFHHWRRFLEAGGDPAKTIYKEPPDYLTRMWAVLSQIPTGMVMDTGMAAIHGALCDPVVRSELNRGVLVVNLGNQHTLAALVTEDRILGLWEHHTGALTKRSLVDSLQDFRMGKTRHEAVLKSGGHGCAYHPEGLSGFDFEFVVVTGPQRALAEGLGWFFASPFGNMMLVGCFGLVRALHRAMGIEWPGEVIEE
jgi:uncharacterized protein (DUF1786 family)